MQNLKIYQEVLLKINNIIIEDKLVIGDQLPSERELADRLNVSRSSVREALRILELLGLIKTKQGQGTFIEDESSHQLVEIIASYILRKNKSRADLLEYKNLIEKDIIQLASTKITNEDIDKLEKVINCAQDKLKIGGEVKDEEYLFQNTLALATGNNLLYKIWKIVFTYDLALTKDKLISKEVLTNNISEYKQIINILKNKKIDI